MWYRDDLKYSSAFLCVLCREFFNRRARGETRRLTGGHNNVVVYDPGDEEIDDSCHQMLHEVVEDDRQEHMWVVRQGH